MAGKSTLAKLRFMQKLAVYDKEKPYTIDAEVVEWEGEVERSNVRGKFTEKVIEDIRGREHEFTFEDNGFAVLDIDSSMKYEDFDDSQKVESVYCKEIASCLLRYFDADAVHIFDIGLRRRHPNFPHMDMQPGIPFQPAARVHIDGTTNACFALMGELESPVRKHKRHIFLNVWRPLKGPVYDWPLALCDSQSVNPLTDLDPHDHVHTQRMRENIMVYFSPEQRWYYLSGQMPSEVLIFRQADTDNKPGVPHSAFDLTLKPDESLPMLRESIELRAVVCFDT